MYQSFRQLAVVPLFIAGFALPESVQADSATDARLHEIRGTWMSIAKSVNSCSYESTLRLSRGVREELPKIATESNHKRIVTPVGYLYESRTYLTDDGKRIFDGHILYVANDHYSCELVDKEDENRFVIIDLPKMQDRNWSEDQTGPEKMRVCLPWLFPRDTFSLADLIDPKLSDISKIEELGGGLLRIPFRPRVDLALGEKEKFRGVTSGALILNRDWHYRLESAELQYDPQFSQTTTIRLSYSDAPGKDYFLKGLESETKFVGRDKVPATARSAIDYECHHNIEYDPRQFYISHYGLPEVLGIEPPKKQSPRYVWFLAVAAAFAVMAVLLRWYVKSRQRPAPPPKMVA